MFSDKWFLKHERFIFCAGVTVVVVAVFMLVVW